MEWLDSHPDEESETYEEKQKEFEEVANPIMTKMYQNAGGEGGMPGAGMPGGMPGAGMPGGMPGAGMPGGMPGEMFGDGMAGGGVPDGVPESSEGPKLRR